MTSSASRTNTAAGIDPLLAELAEDVAIRLRAGEQVDLEAYLSEHPAQEEGLRHLLPAIAMMADLGRSAVRELGGAPSGLGDPGAALGTLGDYRIVREVGRGGMGVVYEARQLSLNRRVALKVLPFAATIDPRQLQRFQNEAQAAAGLHHTHIVPVFAVGCERGVHYYAMQFIEGRSLAEVIGELRELNGRDRMGMTIAEASALAPGPAPASENSATAGRRASESSPGSPGPSQSPVSHIPAAGLASPATAGLSSGSSITSRPFFQTVARLGVQAAEALEYAHSLGVVHRDVKPANLLVDPHGDLWVTDFGLARLHADVGLTMTGDVLGTLRYMSPEQALAKRSIIDHRSDIYSLGVTFYELLTLRPAVEGIDRQEILRRIAFDSPRPLHRLNRSVPRELETIVFKATAKEPEGRYTTALEMAEDLRRFLENKPIRAKQPTLLDLTAKWSRRHVTLVISTAMVLSLAVVGLAISTALITAKQSEIVRQRDAAHWQEERARRIVDEMYTRLSERWLSQDPGDAELRREFLEKAAAYYEEIARAPVKDGGARLETAYAWLRIGRSDWHLRRTREAEAAFKRAVEQFAELADDPSDNSIEAHDGQVYALIRLGDLHFIAGRTAEAESFYSRAIETSRSIVSDHPEYLIGWLGLGEAQTSLGDLLDDDAILSEAEATERKILKDLLERRADVGPIVERLVTYRPGVWLEDPQSIVRTIESGADPRQAIIPQVYRSLAFTLQHLRRFSEAVDCLRFALSAPNQGRSSRAKLLVPLAEDLYLSGKYQEAFQAFRESLELSPNAPKTLEHLADSLIRCPDPRVRDPVEAVRLAMRAVALSPLDPDIWRVLSLAHYRAGDWRAAAEASQKTMELPTSGAFDWLLLGMAQRQLGQREPARASYEKAVFWIEKNNPQDERLRSLRAEAKALLQLEDFDAMMPNGAAAFAR